MKYSSILDKQGILQECESVLFDHDYGKITNSTPLKQTFCRYANRALNKVSSLILSNDNSWEFFDYNSEFLPIDEHNLVAGQDSYVLERFHSKVLRVRVKTPNGNWKTLKHTSRRKLNDLALETSGTPEYYDLLGSSLILTPTPNYSVTKGIEMQHQGTIEFFLPDDTDKEPGFDQMFHHLIPMWMCYFYAFSKRLDILNDLRQEIIVMENELKEHLKQRDYGEVQKMELKKDYSNIKTLI